MRRGFGSTRCVAGLVAVAALACGPPAVPWLEGPEFQEIGTRAMVLLHDAPEDCVPIWDFASRPDGSRAVLAGDATKGSFTPDIAGEFRIELRTCDTRLRRAVRAFAPKVTLSERERHPLRDCRRHFVSQGRHYCLGESLERIDFATGARTSLASAGGATDVVWDGPNVALAATRTGSVLVRDDGGTPFRHALGPPSFGSWSLAGDLFADTEPGDCSNSICSAAYRLEPAGPRRIWFGNTDSEGAQIATDGRLLFVIGASLTQVVDLASEDHPLSNVPLTLASAPASEPWIVARRGIALAGMARTLAVVDAREPRKPAVSTLDGIDTIAGAIGEGLAFVLVPNPRRIVEFSLADPLAPEIVGVEPIPAETFDGIEGTDLWVREGDDAVRFSPD